jgi:8-oxo-dGTP pyrophosphatase MutT (NUDIX family)
MNGRSGERGAGSGKTAVRTPELGSGASLPAPPIHARREISRNRFLTYVEEDLSDRHGQPYTYYQVEARFDAVVVVPLLADGRLVLERIYRHPYRTWLLEFPAGGIEPGEDPLVAAGRELGEETGYRAGRLTKLGTMEAMPGLLRMRLTYVLAEDLSPGAERALEALEMLQVEELSVQDAWKAAEETPASSFLTTGLLYLDRHLRRSP